MKSGRYVVPVVLLFLGAAPAPAPDSGDALWHHRNLGKAFYENPTTQLQAVAEFKAALDLAPGSARERLNYGLALLKAGKTAEGIAELEAVQKQDPSLPHTWFNLGVAFKRASDYDRAIHQFEGMVERASDEPASHYNLGVLYNGAGRPFFALRELETAERLDPGLAAPHFQLYNAYKSAGRAADAARELKAFQEIKQRQAGAAVPEDLEWSFYSEIYDPVEATPAGVPAAAPLRLVPHELARGLDAATAGLTLLDADGDGRPDLLAWSAAGARLFLAGPNGALTPVAASGLEELKGIVAAAAGDFDNDGLPDLCILTQSPAGDSAVRLFRNQKGKFAEVPLPAPAGPFRAALWLDYDHDYDLDLILLGDRPALLRNNGDGTWTAETARFPFAAGRALAGATLHAISDSQGTDLAVSYEDHAGVLYRDRLGGRYEAEPFAALPARSRSLAARDLDDDGWTDLAATTPTTPTRLVLLRNRSAAGRGEGSRRQDVWEALAAPAEVTSATGAFAFADFENRGVSDLAAGGKVFFGRGAGQLDASGAPGIDAAAVVAADFDGDGRTDLAAVGADGVLRLFHNATETAQHWLGVGLAGVKNLKLAPGAEVEVKAGASYQKLLYAGTPLVFGLGAYTTADTVRITWPNGLIQNEPRQTAGQARVYKEAQRLSGSCPMIFTWDGERYRFITDVLGVAPLGASSGDGEYFPVDHDEYVQIPGEALAALPEVNGRFSIHVTEELREVSYLDQIRLLALDHPREVEIFTNDKFKGPPFPEYRLFGVRRRIYPRSARDGDGRDVLPRLLAKDATYPDGFRRDYAGVAEIHTLDLDFGADSSGRPVAADGRAVLILSGWVDWADGSTFLGTAQRTVGNPGLLMPQLQVKDAAGRWKTVIEDMGIPSGKPKTIAVDLTGKFLSASREVRIVTNLCVYWDEIFLSEETAAPAVRTTVLDPAAADLHFRGFSTPVIHPQRKQPEEFDYSHLQPLSMWNPTPGLYTRYGDVTELLTDLDDRLLIMGSGDEVRLSFAASRLPPLPAGWRRDFLLLVDGWAKDADANTAFGETVEPLPFHGMSRYPYPTGEHFPADPEHARYRAEYNTRPALRLIRSLRPEGASGAPGVEP